MPFCSVLSRFKRTLPRRVESTLSNEAERRNHQHVQRQRWRTTCGIFETGLSRSLNVEALKNVPTCQHATIGTMLCGGRRWTGILLPGVRCSVGPLLRPLARLSAVC
jgi:hypothetical protein